ncbi:MULTISPECIES: hypothetical protein [unclassified Bradyrhizobium]
MPHYFLNAGYQSNRDADTRGFKALATAFLASSHEVSDLWVKLFLIYHSIECALKAYLASQGALVESDLNHHIVQLARKSASCGLVLTPEESGALQYFESTSKDGKKNSPPSVAFRYNITGSAATETPDVLQPIVQSILKQIEI